MAGDEKPWLDCPQCPACGAPCVVPRRAMPRPEAGAPECNAGCPSCGGQFVAAPDVLAQAEAAQAAWERKEAEDRTMCPRCDWPESEHIGHTAGNPECPGPAVEWRARAKAYEGVLERAITDAAASVAQFDPNATEPTEAQMTLARLQGAFDAARRTT